MAQRYPGYALPPDFQCMVEPGGGFLVPEKCIELHLRLARQRGAELRCGSQVVRWEVLPTAAADLGVSGGGDGGSSSSGEGGLVWVHITGGEHFTARKLVLAGGGWMPHLVPELQVGARG